MRRRCAADTPPAGLPSAASGGPHRPLQRERAATGAQAVGEGGSASTGVGGVHGAGRTGSGRPQLGRWAARQRRCNGACFECNGGRKIATGRPPRRLRGGSMWVGAGLGVVPGRARAGWGGAETSQVLPWPPARQCAIWSEISGKIDILGDYVPSTSRHWHLSVPTHCMTYVCDRESNKPHRQRVLWPHHIRFYRISAHDSR